MSHASKMAAAKDAISQVFSDTTVSQVQTRESLEELLEDIQDRLRLLHDDEHPPEDDDGGYD